MAYVISLLDGDFAPQRGEVGVMLFLRSSENGYRAQATAIFSNGQPSRRLGAWSSTCPVAASQEMYQWVSSAGWLQDQIFVANNSQYRPDQIMGGHQPVQRLDWSGNHSAVLQLMLSAFGGSPQPQQEPQAQPQAQPQVQPEAQPQAQPRHRQETQPQPQIRVTGAASIGEREKELGRLLADSVRGLRSGASAQDIIRSLSDSFVDIYPDEDEHPEDEDGDLEDEDDGDEDAESEVTDSSVDSSALRPLRPGETMDGLTPEQMAHFHALSDPRAEEKMRRGIERSQQAILRARQVSAAWEKAGRPREPVANTSDSRSITEPPSSTESSSVQDNSNVNSVIFQNNGISYTSVEIYSSTSGKSPATVRLWCRQGKIPGAIQGRVSGDKVDRWLIPVEVG